MACPSKLPARRLPQARQHLPTVPSPRPPAASAPAETSRTAETAPQGARAAEQRRMPSPRDRARWPVLRAKAGEERRTARARWWGRLDGRSRSRRRGVRCRCVTEGVYAGARPLFEREREARSEDEGWWGGYELPSSRAARVLEVGRTTERYSWVGRMRRLACRARRHASAGPSVRYRELSHGSVCEISSGGRGVGLRRRPCKGGIKLGKTMAGAAVRPRGGLLP